MTPNRRIALNVVATYGRSLYAMVIGLFSARWVLVALGTSDFGLYGVVGGLVVFVSFANNLLQMAIGRFYAVKVGETKVASDKERAIDECRKWFSTALLIHMTVPVMLMCIGYPIGEWAVRAFLTIPNDRVADCVWVWRFVSVTCLVGMMSVPFNAMYTAKQEIAELTLYGFATTTLNAIFYYYMATHSGVWLVRYSVWICLMSVIPNVIIAIRAVVKYPECRLRIEYLWDFGRIRDIFSFAGARFVTAISGVFFTQGQSVLANKYFGPVFNAAMTIGQNVSSHAATLSSSLSGAFWPAIANAAGEKDFEKMKNLAFMTCRLGALLLLVFVIPLALEINEVLLLWLKTPPSFAAEICVAILISYVLERSTDGYWMAIFGIGKDVFRYSWTIGWIGLIGFFVSWILIELSIGRWSVCIAYISSRALTVVMRLYLGRKLANLSAQYWLRRVAFPLLILSVTSCAAGCLPRLLMDAGFLRVCLTTMMTTVVFCVVLWSVLLVSDERKYLLSKFVKRRGK